MSWTEIYEVKLCSLVYGEQLREHFVSTPGEGGGEDTIFQEKQNQNIKPTKNVLFTRTIKNNINK